MPFTAEAAPLSAALMPWYARYGRHTLPWRVTRDPYSVLVSEVMLQQTQVDRVLPRYVAWLQRWPSASALAEASVADVIREWSGLGYNRRAVNLHRAAQIIAEKGFPAPTATVRGLPGVGFYTCAAVASFAFDEPVAVVDTNIGRCLARVALGKPSQRSLAPRIVAANAHALLPAANIRDHNLALMDLGATVCQARAPRCAECPLPDLCEWRRTGFPTEDLARKESPRFVATARFARGRIVEALRARESLSATEVAAMLPGAHRPQASVYLEALERDGLVVQTTGGDWALPGPDREVTAG